jgi:Flp pilus assembly protein TadG
MERIKNSHKGQTVIETALMIMLLFILFFGIAEISRFWWLKNQINNAARVSVRVAIVDSSLTAGADSDIGTCSYNSGTNSCSSGAPGSIEYAACSSITNSSICTGAVVHLTVTGVDDSGNPGGTIVSPGGIVTVTVRRQNVATIVPGLASLSFGLIPSSINLTSQSTMRHE